MFVTIGALAHVDAGKTTLCESILYKTKAIASKGRVDHQDAFLDYNVLERQKGITIYNKEARFVYKDKDYIYLDTPGHSDLASIANQAIKVLDAAILIIAGNEDIPLDTIKQFNNLKNYHIPILLFVNKMDIEYTNDKQILTNLKNKLDSNCVNHLDTYEHLSLLNEELLDEYLNTNKLDDSIVKKALSNNDIYPVFFGSALKDEGIEQLLDYINQFIDTDYNVDEPLNAYIYKIDQEYSYIKVLSGILQNKTTFNEYKINEMYEVSGTNYNFVQSANAGNVVAVKGLKDIKIATYLPSLKTDDLLELPSLTYRLISDLDSNELYHKIEAMNQEEPQLKIRLEDNNVFINLNGELHQTIIKETIKDKFKINIDFSNPIIRYKETINEEVYGVGHFEPLRHYGEILVKLEPYDGYKVESKIDNQYINSLINYLNTYIPRGILTNNPLTNIKISILEMKTHLKHTEGQDLIESLRRAIRQGLSKIESTLLEPNYLITINTTIDNQTAIINELSKANITYSIEENYLIASIPVVDFNEQITALKSRLKGNLSFTIEDTKYLECHNSKEVIERRNYDYTHDFRNPAGSVFCKSGAGHYVEPNEVESLMHIDMSPYLNKPKTSIVYNKVSIDEEELKRVFNSIYKPKPRFIEKKRKQEEEYKPIDLKPIKPLIYLIDGYNLMYKIDEDLAKQDLMNARTNTINLVCDFAGYVNSDVILVFDAYKNNNVNAEIEAYDNITIVFTKTNQTADTYIEIKSRELAKDYKVNVVSSDNLEQLKVFSNEAHRISSEEFINRYHNFKKNNQKLVEYKSFKPFEQLKELLQDI